MCAQYAQLRLTWQKELATCCLTVSYSYRLFCSDPTHSGAS